MARPANTTQVSESHRLGRGGLPPLDATQPERGQARLPDHETFFLESALVLCASVAYFP